MMKLTNLFILASVCLLALSCGNGSPDSADAIRFGVYAPETQGTAQISLPGPQGTD